MKTISLFLVFAFVSPVALADSINSHLFRFGDTLETVTTEDALGKRSERRDWKALFRVAYDFVDEPLIGIDSSRQNQNLVVVRNIQSLNLGASYLFGDRLLLGFHLPLHRVKLDEQYTSASLDPTQNALGDFTLHAKYRITGDYARLGIAIMPYVTLPTGDADYFVSDDSFAYGGKILADSFVGKFKLFGNLGYTFANNAEFLNIDRTRRLELAGGAYLPLTPNEKLGVTAEMVSAVTMPNIDRDQDPLELRAALRAKLGNIRAFVGGGFEALRQARSNDLLLFAGLKLPLGSRIQEPVFKPEASQEVEEKPKALSAKLTIEQIALLQKDLTVSREIHFETDKAIIRNASYPALKSAAQMIKPHIDKIDQIQVQGHTDSVGSDAYNMDLSQRRAQAVVDYLVSQSLPADKLVAKGYGETRPIDSNDSVEGRAANRRVEFNVSASYEVEVNE